MARELWLGPMHWLGLHHALRACGAFLVALRRAPPAFSSCPPRQPLSHLCDPTSYSALYPQRGSFLCCRCFASTPAWCPCLWCSVSLDRYALVKGDNTTERGASQRGRAATRLFNTGGISARNASLAPVLGGNETRAPLLSGCLVQILPISRDAPARFIGKAVFLKTPFAILKFCPRSGRGRWPHTLTNPCFFDPMPKFKWTISGAPKSLIGKIKSHNPRTATLDHSDQLKRCPQPCRAELPQKQQLVVQLGLPARVTHSRQPSHQ